MSVNIIKMNDCLIENTQQQLAETLGPPCISCGKEVSMNRQGELYVE